MSSSVELMTSLSVYTLVVMNVIYGWELPQSCHPLYLSFDIVSDDDNDTTLYPTRSPTIDPTLEPTPIPSRPSRSPTPSPIIPYDIKCCQDINSKWYYDENDGESSCLQLHDKESCSLNGQSRIDSINLEYCNLKGIIPQEIGYMEQLRFLFLGHNQITGTIPQYFNNYNRFSILQYFYLNYNNIQGLIPSNLFQYAGLRYINFENNKDLIFDITNLNMTDSPVFQDKPAINVNFSFISPKLDNDTDASFYIFFDKLRFNTFSMRASTNNFTFKWENIDSKTNKYHKLYATETFDLYGNNLTGQFPCFFKKWPNNLIFAENFIESSNITCYQTSNNFDNLMLFQQEAVYKNVDKCYLNYAIWGTYTDHYKYCMYSNYQGSPPSIKGCCNYSISPTPKPTETNNSNSNQLSADKWLINNIEYFILILILSFGFIIYFLWKKKKKPRLASAEMTQRIHHHQTQRKITNGDKESLLYGDF